MFRLQTQLTVTIVYLRSRNVSSVHTIDVRCYFTIVCAVSDLVQLRCNLCPYLLDNGSEDIQALPNGLAFMTSVSSGAVCSSY